MAAGRAWAAGKYNLYALAIVAGAGGGNQPYHVLLTQETCQVALAGTITNNPATNLGVQNIMPLTVFDVGLHDGRDTAHYLREGARVIAIEANPALCDAAKLKFAVQVRRGQLDILNLAISDKCEVREFWICDDDSHWSSLHRDLASRNGANVRRVNVECVTMSEMIQRYGIPDYIKVDIEGSDLDCVSGLGEAAPKYISLEMSEGEAEVMALQKHGYDQFKIICQNDGWRQVTSRNVWFYGLGSRNRFVRMATKLNYHFVKYRSGRRFGESGPWGEQSSGHWQDADSTIAVCQSLRKFSEAAGVGGLGWWWDLHAAMPTTSVSAGRRYEVPLVAVAKGVPVP